MAELKKTQAAARKEAMAILTAPGAGARERAEPISPIRMAPVTAAGAAAFQAAAFGAQVARGAAAVSPIDTD